MFEFLYTKGKFYGFRVSEETSDLPFQQAPILWCASQSLFQAIRTDSPIVPWKHQIKNLNREISALVEVVSPNDQLAKLVINSIPSEAKERGVFSQEALRKRFDNVEKVARKVDLIPSEGAPLLVHILSYVQSLLLIKSDYCTISQSELNDEQQDFSKLTTDEILIRAKFYLEMGDLSQALKYMNLLKGAPRSIAKQWMNEARILLETQQAANLLMTHAAFSGLKYL